MRHKVYGKKLSRDKNERTALFKNLVRSLILHENIQTTGSKAKAVKGLVDKIINQAKTPTTKRLVSQFLVDKNARERLSKELLPKLKERNSGYTRIVKMGRRLGDGAMIVRMELLLSDEKKMEATKVASGKAKNSAARKKSGKVTK